MALHGEDFVILACTVW